MNDDHNWREEKRAAYLYKVMAEKESDSSRKQLFEKLSGEAGKQAAIWAKKANRASTIYSPDLRTRVVAFLVRRLGVQHLRMILSSMKVRGMAIYSKDTVSGHSMPSSVQELGRRHRGMGVGGNLRAAVFGVNDGLVSNASLVMGIVGASNDPKIILLSGIAGLLAGSFSMAAGEFISVRSQAEMFEYQIGLERDELKEYPEEEAEELALIYKAKGLSMEEAHRVAKKLISDPERALDTLAREELGLNPEDLGSPWGAAVFSFFSFATGAAVPLIPFLLEMKSKALPMTMIFTAIALFIVGAILSLFTGRSAILGGLRMLAIGAAAGAATYFIGKILGVSLG